jgi:hypothetical protein
MSELFVNSTKSMSEPIEAVDLEKKVQEKNISLRPSGIT